MSWFSHLLGKLFGRKKTQSAPVASALPGKPRSARVVPAGITYADNTLGWLLGNSQGALPEQSRYNFENPPAIAPDVLARLRTHIGHIPPMPEIWHQVQDILQQPDASASDLGKCVAKDPVLTAQILKVCNSSAYAGSAGEDISNIPLAIARLGLDEASSIIFRSLAPDLGGSEQRKTEIRHIWFHSQAVAMLSRILAESSPHLSRHDATLTGMLHDIGKLVILHVESDEKLHRLRAMIDAGMPSLEAEQAGLGYTHIDAGMMLALHWRLPRQVQGWISFHHKASDMKAERLPESARHAMVTLHVAHVVLQHDGQSGGQVNVASTWQSHQRARIPDTLRFMQQETLVPLDSELFYERLLVDLNRLKLSFSDLFQTGGNAP